MAAPTSNNEVTARRLTRLLTGSDGNGGLWGKIKDKLAGKQDTLAAQTAYTSKGTATKVPQITTNSLGQVTGITEVTITGVTPASHTHGNIANGGTLTDTAAAAAGNDYVVIRDADNAKIQTSTIKGTDVADAVTKKHSHSTLTLSTTAQAYDGSHTLALPSTDPYTSARTPSSHTHGNITNGGALQTTDVTIANGDKLVVTDASDSNKVARTSVSFDGSTTGTLLSRKGTWENPKEAYLAWGGRNLTGSFGPLDAALVSELGANRFACGKAAGITIEYTRDGGTTWVDYGASDLTKRNIFTNRSSGFTVGKADSTNKATTAENYANYKARVIINCGAFGIYNAFNKFVFYVSTNGSASCYMKMSGVKQAETSDIWTAIGEMQVTGWSGFNVYNQSVTMGVSSYATYKKICFLFECRAAGDTNYNGLYIAGIWGYGGVGWTTPSTLASTGHVYTVNGNQEATFPSTVTATGFSGPLTGNATSATKLATARKLAASLSNTSSDTSFDGSADVTNIKVSGTLPIANGGTGATKVTGSTGALHNLTNDQIGTASQWFLTITNGWDRCGYCSVADAKTVLGLKGAAFLDTGTSAGTVATGDHTHGNISNTGTLTDTAAAAAGNDYVVIRDADNAKVQTSTIKGTDVADAVSKKHSHSTLTLSTTAQAYDGSHTLALPSSDPYTSARTPASHTHGNIQNGGALQTTDVTIASGDKLVITDSSDSSKIARASVSFDGSTVTTALTPKGTFETFSKLTIGTTSTTAAAGDHTHTLTLASGGTSTVDLAANTAYTLTAGGKSIVFKTPADNNTDTKQRIVASTAKTYLTGVTTAPTSSNQDLIGVASTKVYATDGVLTATSFSGNLTGNVTGNCSGSSGSCTGNAATATTATNSNNVKVTTATTTTLYLTGVDSSSYSSGSNNALKTDTGIYAETTSGSLRATQFNVAGQCILNYDTTTSAVYFTFS